MSSDEVSGRYNKHTQTNVKHEHMHKGECDGRDEANPSSSKPYKCEKKFIEVNFSYKTMYKEVGRDIMGTPSITRVNNPETRKASNKWCVFHEDYDHLTKDSISLKVCVNNLCRRASYPST